jgi:hypothetical protein
MNFKITMDPGVPTSPLLNYDVDNEITLSWGNPTKTGGLDFKFDVKVYDSLITDVVSSSTPIASALIPHTDQKTFTVNSLTPGTQYCYFLSAKNHADDDVENSIIKTNFIVDKDPGVPTNFGIVYHEINATQQFHGVLQWLAIVVEWITSIVLLFMMLQ